MSHDQKCQELVEYFMPEGTGRQTIERIAERIQDMIEDEIRDMENDIKIGPG